MKTYRFFFADGRVGFMMAEGGIIGALKKLTDAIKPYFPQGLVKIECAETGEEVSGELLAWFRDLVSQANFTAAYMAMTSCGGPFPIETDRRMEGVLNFS